MAADLVAFDAAAHDAKSRGADWSDNDVPEHDGLLETACATHALEAIAGRRRAFALRQQPATGRGEDSCMKALIPTPDAGFDHPLEILDGCHLRIRRQCETIQRLVTHLAAHGADAEAADAARAVMRFFDTAGGNHHRDEEEDLFPALHRHAPSAELHKTDNLIARLRADHDKLDALWSDMRPRLRAVIGGDGSQLDSASATAVSAAYERHVNLEEAELLPLARRVLDSDVIASLGKRMARRRGIAMMAVRAANLQR